MHLAAWAADWEGFQPMFHVGYGAGVRNTLPELTLNFVLVEGGA